MDTEQPYPSTHGLVSARELRPSGVPLPDPAAFALESGWRNGENFTDRVSLYCPPCVQIQFDLNAEPSAAACSTCGHTFRPGVASAMRDAFVILTALKRFDPEETFHVEQGSASLIDRARHIYNARNDHPRQAQRRHAWTYTLRGQRLLAAAEEELRENAALYTARHPRKLKDQTMDMTSLNSRVQLPAPPNPIFFPYSDANQYCYKSDEYDLYEVPAHELNAEALPAEIAARATYNIVAQADGLEVNLQCALLSLAEEWLVTGIDVANWSALHDLFKHYVPATAPYLVNIEPI